MKLTFLLVGLAAGILAMLPLVVALHAGGTVPADPLRLTAAKRRAFGAGFTEGLAVRAMPGPRMPPGALTW